MNQLLLTTIIPSLIKYMLHFKKNLLELNKLLRIKNKTRKFINSTYIVNVKILKFLHNEDKEIIEHYYRN
ncbi:hypothetical protein HYD98_02645 [Mycoplasmopsis bovis]|nr:hypothetical protein [Mycoplasmopsis bovis]QQH29299.1 hypothetical protein HYD98_02645 [Mycoplasmopsis bovis]